MPSSAGLVVTDRSEEDSIGRRDHAVWAIHSALTSFAETRVIPTH